MAAARWVTGLSLRGIEAWPEVPLAITFTFAGTFSLTCTPMYCGFAVFHKDAAAFVDGETRGDFVPMLVHGELHAGRAVGFFVTFGEEDHVAVQARAGAFQLDEDGEICGEHAFVVNGAAPVEVAVFYDRGEGVHGPFGFVHADNIQVSHQEQRARRIGHGAGRKARDDEAAAGRAFENFRRNAFF